jgi:hypothetical protein
MKRRLYSPALGIVHVENEQSRYNQLDYLVQFIKKVHKFINLLECILIIYALGSTFQAINFIRNHILIGCRFFIHSSVIFPVNNRSVMRNLSKYLRS